MDHKVARPGDAWQHSWQRAALRHPRPPLRMPFLFDPATPVVREVQDVFEVRKGVEALRRGSVMRKPRWRRGRALARPGDMQRLRRRLGSFNAAHLVDAYDVLRAFGAEEPVVEGQQAFHVMHLRTGPEPPRWDSARIGRRARRSGSRPSPSILDLAQSRLRARGRAGSYPIEF